VAILTTVRRGSALYEYITIVIITYDRHAFSVAGRPPGTRSQTVGQWGQGFTYSADEGNVYICLLVFVVVVLFVYLSDKNTQKLTLKPSFH